MKNSILSKAFILGLGLGLILDLFSLSALADQNPGQGLVGKFYLVASNGKEAACKDLLWIKNSTIEFDGKAQQGLELISWKQSRPWNWLSPESEYQGPIVQRSLQYLNATEPSVKKSERAKILQGFFSLVSDFPHVTDHLLLPGKTEVSDKPRDKENITVELRHQSAVYDNQSRITIAFDGKPLVKSQHSHQLELFGSVDTLNTRTTLKTLSKECQNVFGISVCNKVIENSELVYECVYQKDEQAPLKLCLRNFPAEQGRELTP